MGHSDALLLLSPAPDDDDDDSAAHPLTVTVPAGAALFPFFQSCLLCFLPRISRFLTMPFC